MTAACGACEKAAARAVEKPTLEHGEAHALTMEKRRPAEVSGPPPAASFVAESVCAVRRKTQPILKKAPF